MYEKLSKLYYKLDSEKFCDELNKRLDCYGSYRTNLTIKGFRKGKNTKDEFELFYVNIPELMQLNNSVLKNSAHITTLIHRLPDFVVQPYFHKLIINEAQSNNEIEGVKSTKRELGEALSQIGKDDSKNKRFLGLMKTYLHINEIPKFERVEDFRKLYDQLVSEEIEPDDKLDGELFRTKYVEVNDGTMTTHIGMSGEQSISQALQQLILYLQNETQPDLYKYMVAHYYYEYIHPFYDGNGRTGRLLVGSYLARYLEKYSAITFSYAVNKNKNKYYKALEEIPHPLNRGEITFYLMDMLELLAEGQQGIIEDLEVNLFKLQKIHEFIAADQSVTSNDMKRVFYILLTINVFVSDTVHLGVRELMSITNLSRYKLKAILDQLVQLGYIEGVNKNPLKYKVVEECLDEIVPM